MATGDDRAGDYVKRQRRAKQPGKGSKQRPLTDKEKFEKNWDAINWKKKKSE